MYSSPCFHRRTVVSIARLHRHAARGRDGGTEGRGVGGTEGGREGEREGQTEGGRKKQSRQPG